MTDIVCGSCQIWTGRIRSRDAGIGYADHMSISGTDVHHVIKLSRCRREDRARYRHFVSGRLLPCVPRWHYVDRICRTSGSSHCIGASLQPFPVLCHTQIHVIGHTTVGFARTCLFRFSHKEARSSIHMSATIHLCLQLQIVAKSKWDKGRLSGFRKATSGEEQNACLSSGVYV